MILLSESYPVRSRISRHVEQGKTAGVKLLGEGTGLGRPALYGFLLGLRRE